MADHHRTCPLCEAMCGLRITTVGDQVTRIVGDPDDPLSKGFLCPKAHALGELHHSPERIRRPLRRVGSDFEEISWEVALSEAADRISRHRRRSDMAVAYYTGNPVGHDVGAISGSQLLKLALATKMKMSASTLDQRPKELANALLYGTPYRFAVPDIDRTQLLVVLGANPMVSNGSLMAAPGFRHRERALRERGGRMVVIDPRRTETADRGEWVPIRPGTDAFWLAALARELAPTGPLAEALAPFTPERAATESGIPASFTQTLARDLRRERAVLYGRMGTTAQRHGTLCSWLVDVINHLAGNLDVVGGSMFTEPAADIANLLKYAKPKRGRWTTPVRGAAEVFGEVPVATLAEEIEAGTVSALITLAGNPVVSSPGGAALAEQLARLDTYVAIDLQLNESTRHAHLILPPQSPLERSHFDLALAAVAIQNTVKYGAPIFDAPPDSRSDWDILTDLAARIAPTRGRRATWGVRAGRWFGTDRLIAALMRLGPWPLTLEAVQSVPSGIDLGPLRPGRLQAPPRLDAPEILSALGALNREHASTAPLLLIGRRDLRSNNSWMNELPSLARGPDRCTLHLHPEDAARAGISDKQRTRILSEHGEVVAPAVLSDRMTAGVASLPHGWAHCSLNDLTDPAHLDELSGTSVLSVPVRIEPA